MKWAMTIESKAFRFSGSESNALFKYQDFQLRIYNKQSIQTPPPKCMQHTLNRKTAILQKQKGYESISDANLDEKK